MRYREDWVEPLRTCFEGADDWFAVERCFQGHVGDDEIEDGRPVVYAFGYMLVNARRDELRERTGVFAPRIEWGNGAAFPDPLSDVPEETLLVWETYAESTADNPVAASRFHDLLWVRRHGDSPVESARKAIDAYLDLSESWQGMQLVECFSRALEIAVQIKDAGRIETAVKRAMTEAEAEMGTEEWRPGITLGLIEGVVALEPERRPEELSALLDAAEARYGRDPFIAQSVSELQAALASSDDQEQLHRGQVERWRAESDKATGILRYSHLQHALELARTYGFSASANEILREIQGMSPEDLELKRIGTEVNIPREEVDAYVGSIAADADSWPEALTRFGVHGPPSGDVPDNQKLVKELAEQHPLTSLLPRQVLGELQSLLFQAGDPEQHERLELAQQEALRIRMWAPLSAQMLDAIKDRFGAPDRAELIDFFTTDLIDPEVADRLADGVLRFLDGDEEGSLHVLLPQIEAAVRGLAAQAGVTVIKNPQGVRPGGVRALGGVLADLEGRMDESWRHYLNNALVDPLGVNLRNQVSHGLHGPVTRGEVAVAIHIACYLQLLKAVETEPGSAEADGSA